jgi:hypothetical protein
MIAILNQSKTNTKLVFLLKFDPAVLYKTHTASGSDAQIPSFY